MEWLLLIVAEILRQNISIANIGKHATQKQDVGVQQVRNSIPPYNSAWSCFAPNIKWLLLIVAEKFATKKL